MANSEFSGIYHGCGVIINLKCLTLLTLLEYAICTFLLSGVTDQPQGVIVVSRFIGGSWGYTQKNVTQITPEAPAHPCLLQHYPQ
jgi:hypothetical protein